MYGLEAISQPPLNISISRRFDYPNLVHLSYDQIESPRNNEITKECRGLILDEDDNWNIVAYPFNRFANYGEDWADTIDWSTARCQEKLDGSMIVLFQYNGEWLVSMKGNPAGRCAVGFYDFTFEDLFWKVFKDQVLSIKSAPFHPGMTYMWELTSEANRIVCGYAEPRVTLIGVRNNHDLGECPVSTVRAYLPVVQEYELHTVEDVIKAAEILNPMEHEGYVVVDANFHRVKIKSPKYVLIHHLKGGFGQRRILGLIRLGETSEVLSYFPEYMDWYKEVQAKVNEYCAAVDAEYEVIKDIPAQKDFAAAAFKTHNSHFMFEKRKGRATNCFEFLFLSKQSGKGSGEWRYNERQLEEVMGLKSKELKLEE